MGLPAKPTQPLLALTILCLVLPAGAQETDNRPIYYVMLRALESSFVAYNARVENGYEREISRLGQIYAGRLRAVERERAAMDTAWQHALQEHERRRAELDEATAALNTRIEALHDKRRQHDALGAEHGGARARQSRLDLIDEALAEATDAIRELGHRYQSGVSALQDGQDRLRALTEDYRSGRHPAAQKLRQLSEAHQAFARDHTQALESELASYDQARAAFDGWLARRQGELAQLEGSVHEDATRYQAAKSKHDRVHDDLNGLVERYNAIVETLKVEPASGQRRDAAVSEMSQLRARIESGRAHLVSARDEALTLLHAMKARRSKLEQQREQVRGEKTVREHTLAVERARLQGNSERLRSTLAVHRRATEAQVRALEDQVAEHLRSTRDRLEEQAGRISAEFGDDFSELHGATMAWLDGEKPDPPYDGDGSTARFPRTAPAASAVYAAVRRIDEQREEAGRIVEEIRASGEAVVASAEALTRENDELSRERARIRNAHQELRASWHRARDISRVALENWSERRRRVASRRIAALEELKAVYETRLALTSLEFETLQSMLLAPLRDERPATVPGADAAMLHADLARQAAHAGLDTGGSLLERNALFSAILAASAPRAVPANDASSATSTTWASYRGQPIAGRRQLEGESKHATIRSWFDTLSSRAPLAPLRAKLVAHLVEFIDDVDVAGVGNRKVERFLAALFEAGMSAHANLFQTRFENETMGLQAIILDQRYWIEAGGSLEWFPER